MRSCHQDARWVSHAATRCKGRFSSYLYRVAHIVRTTGHGRRLAGGRPIYRGTKQPTNTPKPPEESREERREREARRRVEQNRAVFGPGAT